MAVGETQHAWDKIQKLYRRLQGTSELTHAHTRTRRGPERCKVFLETKTGHGWIAALCHCQGDGGEGEEGAGVSWLALKRIEVVFYGSSLKRLYPAVAKDFPPLSWRKGEEADWGWSEIRKKNIYR